VLEHRKLQRPRRLRRFRNGGGVCKPPQPLRRLPGGAQTPRTACLLRSGHGRRDPWCPADATRPAGRKARASRSVSPMPRSASCPPQRPRQRWAETWLIKGAISGPTPRPRNNSKRPGPGLRARVSGTTAALESGSAWPGPVGLGLVIVQGAAGAGEKWPAAGSRSSSPNTSRRFDFGGGVWEIGLGKPARTNVFMDAALGGQRPSASKRCLPWLKRFPPGRSRYWPGPQSQPSTH